MPCAFSVKARGRSSASSVRFSPGVTGVDDGALGSGSSGSGGAKCRLVPWADNSAPVLLVPIPVREMVVWFGFGRKKERERREESAAAHSFSLFQKKKTCAKTQEHAGGVSGSDGGGFGSDDGLLSSDGGRYSSSPGAGGDALLFRNGVAASIRGAGGGNEGRSEEKPATTAALAVARSSGSSSSSVSSFSSSSSASPPGVFVPCDGSSSSRASPLLLSVPRFGLWALQALAVDAAGNEGQPVACALSFEREAGGLALSPLAIGAIAVGAAVVLVGGVAVGCWLRRR